MLSSECGGERPGWWEKKLIPGYTKLRQKTQICNAPALKPFFVQAAKALKSVGVLLQKSTKHLLNDLKSKFDQFNEVSQIVTELPEAFHCLSIA